MQLPLWAISSTSTGRTLPLASLSPQQLSVRLASPKVFTEATVESGTQQRKRLG